MPNSGIAAETPLLTPEAARAASLLVLQRRERFAARRPEIDIRAKRVDGRLVFYVTEPGRDIAKWSDPTEMMDDLEARYLDVSDDDIATMDDPTFIAERRKLHDALDDADGLNATPEDQAALRERYRRVELEFLHRAGMSWRVP